MSARKLPDIGQPLPDLALPVTDNPSLNLTDLRGQRVVLYFYPKDNTSGCTLEAQDFRDAHAKFRRLKTVILGVSRDSLKSHAGFRTKQSLPFDLVSDADEKLCKLFGVLKEKNMYGRKVIGIERSTFIVDEKGVLRHALRGVKVPDHVADVLDKVRDL
jgi:peroxiredoxin Q/BCP